MTQEQAQEILSQDGPWEISLEGDVIIFASPTTGKVVTMYQWVQAPVVGGIGEIAQAFSQE
jgi:hypothetical protein